MTARHSISSILGDLGPAYTHADHITKLDFERGNFSHYFEIDWSQYTSRHTMVSKHLDLFVIYLIGSSDLLVLPPAGIRGSLITAGWQQ